MDILLPQGVNGTLDVLALLPEIDVCSEHFLSNPNRGVPVVPVNELDQGCSTSTWFHSTRSSCCFRMEAAYLCG